VADRNILVETATRACAVLGRILGITPPAKASASRPPEPASETCPHAAPSPQKKGRPYLEPNPPDCPGCPCCSWCGNVLPAKHPSLWFCDCYCQQGWQGWRNQQTTSTAA